MASISIPAQNPLLNQDGVVSFSKYPLSSSSATTFFGSKLRAKSIFFPAANNRRGRARDVRLNTVTAASRSFDVVIVGAGIIGLTTARQFLTGSDLSVAVVDKAVPLSGATGAGQGYIWMAHRTPGSDTWELALRSHKMWELFAESMHASGLDPLQVMGWKKTGSLLIGRTSEELATLEKKVKELSKAGVRAEYLTVSELLIKEPALLVGEESGAALLPDDAQMDAQRTVSYILKENRSFKSRYVEFYNDPVTSLISCNGKIEGIQTSKNTLYGKTIVIAAGCWSGSLVDELFREVNIQLHIPVKPRKGHLLVLENFNSFQVNHGAMEVGYADHLHEDGEALSISMTATMDTMGNLVLGSSRQFAGFNTEVDESIINLIWNRAAEFFPKMRDLSLSDFRKNREVRVGLRPYMPDGKPVIGPVPSLPNIYLAAGHEGGGLAMALGTAEMVVDMVLGNPAKLDQSPFSVQAHGF